MDQVGFSNEQHISCIAPFNIAAYIYDSFSFLHCNGVHAPLSCTQPQHKDMKDARQQVKINGERRGG